MLRQKLAPGTGNIPGLQLLQTLHLKFGAEAFSPKLPSASQNSSARYLRRSAVEERIDHPIRQAASKQHAQPKDDEKSNHGWPTPFLVALHSPSVVLVPPDCYFYGNFRYAFGVLS